jgi:3-oxoadipate enol-lactonase
MTALHVVTHGARTKPAVLFVHPLGTDHRFWDAAADALAADYFCITPDLQGAGGTPNPPAPVTAEGHAADLASVLADLGIARAALAGCALGGMVAATLAAMRPPLVAGLVMTNPGLSNAEAVKSILRERVAQVRSRGMQALLPAAPAGAFNGMPRDARFDRYVERYVAQDAEGYALTVLGFLDIDIRPILPRLACPMLLIPGGKDIFMPPDAAELIAVLVPWADIVRFDDVAHLIPYQAPERFVAAVRPFLAAKAAWQEQETRQ